MSAVPVVLAMLLQLLSRSLDTVPYGIGICRTLLQKRQLELISRNLSADKGKSFIISPTLRLLREIISFDGGVVAKPLFRARAYTLKSLARNMGIVHLGDEPEDVKRPSTRSTAILFFLSALKFLHPEAKKELISQRDIVAALTRDIKQDPPYLARDVLSKLRECVLMDDKIPREAKGSLLHASTLIRISALYQVRQTAEDGDSPSLAEAAHDFLMTACTTPSCGVLRQDSGYYPRDVDLDAVMPTQDLEELGLESIVWMNKYKDKVPVRNFGLANFLEHLRPWASVQQSDLVVAIFRVAPELVAHYFLEHNTFTFEPKLTATWFGYAAFLYKTVNLPVSEYFGQASGFPQLPPPTSVVIENILPLPLNQKVLVRCLVNKSNIVSFFATRLLVIAIEKLNVAIKMHQDPSHPNGVLWGEAGRRLVDEFCQRSPGIKDMINSYRSIPEGDVLHRDAASRLLRLCYEVLPQVALMAKFDVSPFLETALKRLAKNKFGDGRDFAMSLKELENLLAIAGYSPGMRWFSASEALSLTPFTMLLKVCVDAPTGVSLDGIRQVLNFVAIEQQLVPAQREHPVLLPLLETLQQLGDSSSSSGHVTNLWAFLDNCLTRCASAPVKYLELIRDLLPDTGDAVASPLVATLLEQIPFAIKAADKDVLSALGEFLPKYLGLLVTAGESKRLLKAVYSKMAELFKESSNKFVHKRIPKDMTFKHSTWPLTKKDGSKARNDRSTDGQEQSPHLEMDDDELKSYLEVPDGLGVDNLALTKWVSKTADELVEEGYAANLIKLLASEHGSIRKEALVNILKAAARIHESEYEEKEQIWLLLSEIAETARSGNIDVGPLPSPTVAFACHALATLRDPLSSLYPKVNEFLIRGPVWRLDRLPLLDEILLEDPVTGDSYYAQVNWLLGYLCDGLRTPQDLELFHKRRAKGPVLESILALAGNPYMRAPLRTQVLRLLYRVTCIQGGSTTLTTRFGVVNWLEAQEKASLAGKDKSKGVEMARLYRGLKERIWRTCDQERVEGWSKGGIKVLCQAEA